MKQTVTVCRDDDEFLAVARVWRPGDAFPLVAGAAAERYLALFAGGAPPVTTEPRPGVVLTVDRPGARACARLLATATGRPLLVAEPADLLDRLRQQAGQPVAVVALAPELDEAGDWPGAWHSRVGVLTARSTAALAALIYRTLTADHGTEPRTFVCSHPLWEESQFADVTDFEGLRELTERRPQLVIFRGQGRECSGGMLDGMICGRAEPLARPLLPLVPGLRATPCRSGDGCFRKDLQAEDLMPAADLHAGLFFAHSCSSIAVGAHAYPYDTSFALSLLEGTTVALIGVLGVHIGQQSSTWQLEDALAEGLTLGDAVRRLNELSYPMQGDLASFGLLGDPGLRLTVPSAATSHPVSPPAERRRDTFDEPALAVLRKLAEVVLPRLEDLQWMGLPLPGESLAQLRKEIIDAAHDADAPAPGDRAAHAAQRVAEVQAELVAGLTTEIYTVGWNFGGSSFAAMRQIESAPSPCPSCGRPIATRTVLRHRVRSRLHLQTLQCRRCGDVWWSTEDGPRTLILEGPTDLGARRRTHLTIARTCANTGDDSMQGAAGAAFRQRRYLGLPEPWTAPLRLGPHESRTLTADFDFRAVDVTADTHTTPFVAVLDGIYAASMVMLHVD